MTTADTLPKLLLQNYQNWGEKNIAMRKKEFGIWRVYTWTDCYEQVKYLSLGLISLGLKRGEHFSILGDNNPQWFWAELAGIAAGAVATGIFTDCLAAEVKYIAEHSDATLIVVQDQEQIDKLLQIKDELPLIRKVIYWDPKGLWNYDDPILMSYEELLEFGRTYEQKYPESFEYNVSQGKPNDLAVILYTSGTTKLPKGAMITNRTLIEWTTNYLGVCNISERDHYFSWLLPGWIAEQMFGLTASLISGQVMNFPEDTSTVLEDTIEVSPTVQLNASINLERMISQMQVRISDAAAVKRLVYGLFVPVGHKLADIELEDKGNRKKGAFWSVMGFTAEMMVFKPLRSKHGLHRMRYCWSGGALMGRDAFRFLRGIGLKIKVLYAATETGVIAVHRDELDPGTVGKPLPGVAISPEGEVIIDKRHCFSGYYKDTEATEKAFRDGYFHTGDAGYINENGHLVFWDRMSDIKQLRTGAKFAPQYIETRLRFSPYIEDAFAVGGQERDFVGALITINLNSVGNWLEKRNIPYTTFADASQKLEVRELIRQEIQKMNRMLPDGSGVNKFIDLYKQLDADEAELTRTQKLRRDFMEKHYAELIDILYGDGSTRTVEAPIVYRDGRSGVLKITLNVNPVDLSEEGSL